jgi:hypothetical protein
MTFSFDDELHISTMPTLQNTLHEASNGHLTVGKLFVKMCAYLRRLL